MASITRQIAAGFRWLDQAVEILDPVWRGALILGACSLLWLAFDREPPFKVLQVYPAYAMPGQQVQIVAEVKRDHLRHCAAHMSRYVFDGAGTRWDEPDRHFSPETIKLIAERSPDLLKLSVTVPPEAVPGYAMVVSDLQYRCNVTHTIFPVRTSVQMPFTILRPHQ